MRLILLRIILQTPLFLSFPTQSPVIICTGAVLTVQVQGAITGLRPFGNCQLGGRCRGSQGRNTIVKRTTTFSTQSLPAIPRSSTPTRLITGGRIKLLSFFVSDPSSSSSALSIAIRFPIPTTTSFARIVAEGEIPIGLGRTAVHQPADGTLRRDVWI